MLNSANAEDQPVSLAVHKTDDGQFQVSSRNHPDLPPEKDRHQQTAVSRMVAKVKSLGPKTSPTGW